MGINISFKEAGEIAHLAEISQSSGLGDVISEMFGGCVIRLNEGSPVKGIIDKIPITKPIYVITKTIGLLETKDIIENPIHQSGSILLNRLINNPSISNFMKLSRKFANDTQLISKEIAEIINILDEETLGASMAMLGNTAFALSYSPDTTIDNPIITKINTKGIEYK